jgi:thiol:disulfide interchange protein DsbD
MNFWKALLLISSLLAGNAQAQQDELLPPAEAFKLQGQASGDKVIAEFNIAPGYYMYRKSFKFESETPGATLDQANIPDGHKKTDEFFGEVEVYRGKVAIEIPVSYDNGQPPAALRVKAVGQGCADMGVCYPPLFQTLELTPGGSNSVAATPYSAPEPQTQAAPMQVAANTVSNGIDELQSLFAQATDTLSSDTSSAPAANENSDTSSNDENPLDLLQALGSDIGLADEEEIPEPDTAFQLTTSVDANNVVHADIKIYNHTYLYQDKVKVDLLQSNGNKLGQLKLPKGDKKNDEFFGEMVVYHDNLNISIPLIAAAGAGNQATLSLGYQGCVEDKICYPPITKYLKVDLASKTVTVSDERPESTTADTSADTQPAAADSTMPTAAAAAPAPLGQSEQDEFTSIIAGGSLFIIIGSFFLAGVLLTFTPCVFPMIPILSGIIAGQGDNLDTRKAFSLSLVYVLAMAITYAIAGSLVGYFGAEFNIQAWFQDPWILSIFAGIFVLLALSMFGFYDLQMPSFIQSRLTEFSNKQRGGNLVGVGIMGMLSALIVGPCITAPLVGALVFISQTQDWVLGALALFALGLGMGLPLLLIGTTAGKYLPRAGTWMDAVKAVFGVALIGVAIWLLERILPTSIIMLLMATLIIISAIYMGAIESLPEGSSGWRKFWKGLGFVLLIYGLFYLYGVAAGSKDLIQPLKGITGGGNPTVVYGNMPGSSAAMPMKTHVEFTRIRGQEGLKKALAEASAQGKPVMLDFYADWCISCKEMEKYAFKHPSVLSALSDYVTIQADVTANDKTDQLLMKSLGIYGPPAIIFYDKSGKEIPGSRVVGEMSGEDFAAHIVNFALQK